MYKRQVFYAELIDKLEEELFKHGYKTIICNSEHDSEKEREYIEMLEANQVDGIISGSHNLGIEDYNRVTAPIIAFDRNLSDVYKRQEEWSNNKQSEE